MPYTYNTRKELLRDAWYAMFCTDYFKHDFTLMNCVIYPGLILVAVVLGVLLLSMIIFYDPLRVQIMFVGVFWTILILFFLFIIQYIYNIYMFISRKRKGEAKFPKRKIDSTIDRT